jgi:hypothetical protein
VDLRGRLIAIPVELSPRFVARTSIVVVESAGVAGTTPGRYYDVSADGKRFLIIRSPLTVENGTPPQLNIVLNWGEELKRLAPVKR